MAHDRLGAHNVKLLEAIGALDSAVEKIEAAILLLTTDDDKGDIIGVDGSILRLRLLSTQDSGCCEHVMDWGMPRAMARS